MYFMLDENVPQDLADMLNGQGHKAEFIRDYVRLGRQTRWWRPYPKN
jgi:hypothetical protein